MWTKIAPAIYGNGGFEPCKVIVNDSVEQGGCYGSIEEIISGCSLAGFKRKLDRHLRDKRGYIYIYTYIYIYKYKL